MRPFPVRETDGRRLPADALSVRRMNSEWLLPAAAVGVALVCAFILADRRQIDIDAYVLGGTHVFKHDLYVVQLTGPGVAQGIGFTYPPFAALLFVPLSHLPVNIAQQIWEVTNVGAAVALVFWSIRAAKPEIASRFALRQALVLALVAGGVLEPLRDTMYLGQINMVLGAAILRDLAFPDEPGPFGAPRGVLTGIAAAIKLTPLLLIPYLFWSGQRRAAWTAAATFSACSFVSFAAVPNASHQFWTKDVFAWRRVGAPEFTSNQSLRAMLIRFHHGPVPVALLLSVTAVVTVAGIALAVFAHKHHSPFLGVLVCVATGLLVSPVSWTHHFVWIVPLFAWLTLARDRPRYGRAIACFVGLVFAFGLPWWVPHSDSRELAEHRWQLLIGNSYVIAVLAILMGFAVTSMIGRSADSQRGEELANAVGPSVKVTDHSS